MIAKKYFFILLEIFILTQSGQGKTLVSERTIIGVSGGFGLFCGFIAAGACGFSSNPQIEKIWKLAGATIGICGALVSYRILMAKRNCYLGSTLLGGVESYQPHNIALSFDTYQQHKVSFSDIIGMDHVLDEIKDIIAYFKYPEIYKKLGARLPRGILLEGPPGTGKTMIARACAAEAQCSFLYVSASSFVEMYVGVGAKRLRALFEHARSIKPVIIFFDELDALGAVGREAGANPEYRQSLNELLCQLDGFQEDDDLLVIGATNNAQALDSALKRSGRFDRLLHVPLLDQKGRYALLSHVQNKYEWSDISKAYIEELSYITEGLTAADIKNIFNDAAFLAAGDKKLALSEQHVRQAASRICKERGKG